MSGLGFLLELFLASMVSVARVWLTIAVAVVTGWFLAYASLKSRIFENVYISALEVFESVPVISFFPVVLILFVYYLGGNVGVELAVLFLVFTATVWNIWMGQYQAFKTVPRDMIEVAENFRFTFWDKMAKIYIPYSIPRIASNLLPSFSDGLFYITVSEVFSLGNTTYQVFGIGSVLADLTSKGEYALALEGLAILGIVVVLNVYLVSRFADWAVSRFGLETELVKVRRRGRPRLGLSARISSTLNIQARIARVIPLRGQAISALEEEEEREKSRRLSLSVRQVYVLIGLVLSLLVAVPVFVFRNDIESALPYTGQIIVGLAYDYLRVSVIALISLTMAVFGGYFLVTHPKVEKPVIAFLQTFSAFPAPAYFPLLFLVSYPVVHSMFGPWTNEAYVIFLGGVSTFYYVFYEVWLGIKNIPKPVWELMDNLDLGFFTRLRKIVVPGVLPYIVTGLSSTINSAWGGLAIGEYWPGIVHGHNLEVSHGIMLLFALWADRGLVNLLAWGSFVFGIIVAVYSVMFTRRLMDLARKKYIMEESVYLF